MTKYTKTRVLHLISRPAVGGAERNLLNQLNCLRSTRIEQQVAFRDVNGDLLTDFKLTGIKIHELDSGKYKRYDLRRLYEIIEIVRLIKHNKIDLLHAHMAPSILFGPIAAYFAKIPCIASVHAMKSQLKTSEFQQARIMKYFISMFIEGSNGVIADLYNAGIEKNRMSLISYGVDENTFAKNKETMKKEFRKKWNIPEDAFLIGRIARFERDKGFDLLIELIKQIIKIIPNLHVVLIGDGKEKNSCMKQVKIEGFETKVTFTGFYLNTNEALAAIDLIVITARHEALGISTLEALASGKAFVSYNVGGLGEAIINGKNGITVEFGNHNELLNSIKILSTNLEMKKNFETESYSIFKRNFSIQKMCKDIEKTYYNLVIKSKI